MESGAQIGEIMDIVQPVKDAATRDLVAGTIIGTGTVSNPDFRDVGSSYIAEKRGIETIDEGKARTQ